MVQLGPANAPPAARAGLSPGRRRLISCSPLLHKDYVLRSLDPSAAGATTGIDITGGDVRRRRRYPPQHPRAALDLRPRWMCWRWVLSISASEFLPAHMHPPSISPWQLILVFSTKRDDIPIFFTKREASPFVSQKGMPMVIFFTKRGAKRPFGV